MENLKMMFYASLTFIGVTLAVFLIGSLLIKLLGLAIVLTINHSIAVVISMLCLKYLIHFLIINASPQMSSQHLEDEIKYLKDSNVGLTMILGSVIKYYGGQEMEVQIPKYIINQITENVEIIYTSDETNQLEIFRVKGETMEGTNGKNSLN